VTVWKDNKEIYLISNVYPVSGDETVPRKRKADRVVETGALVLLPSRDIRSSWVGWTRMINTTPSVGSISAENLLALPGYGSGKCSLPVPGEQATCVHPPMDVLAFWCSLICAFCIP